MVVELTEQDIMRLKVIVMDRDTEEALAFIRDRLMPQIQKPDGSMMKNHLEGGKGSMF